MTIPNASATSDLHVAVVIPCRNEARFIAPVIESLLASTHPRERLEVVFVDGMSTDGTRAILEKAAREHRFIRMVDNPRLSTPVAMNLGIRATRAEIIVRLDAHSEYPTDYIPSCVALLLRSGPKAGGAGGRIVPLPNGSGPWARAVAFVTAHRFGVGNARFRTSWKPGLVDTVPGGTFRRKVLDEVGMYDERLTRNQDNELAARLQAAGYSIVFDPSIHVYYRNQATLKGLARQAFLNSLWTIYTLLLNPYTWKWRRFVPVAFVAYLAALAAAACLHAPGLAFAALPLGLYAVLLALFSFEGGREGGGPLRVAATFFSYHLSYGVGSFVGAARVLSGRWRTDLGRPVFK
jgi:cellulose synthase/poly-beta-1,6-N-acetylglucosamine synthase-like glycosyltransferase